ncbi:hypothetical protein nbrc107696_39250 [Gordonia spumicola]|uniref:DUF4262 domain-containing protein n=1 Tax=Gordonia spumicola TaxID=589161 RepID=A0A7I9VDQ5_9ACTN|nr:DUF4262 domain-containing protein [Gordonia spumicola]GEE03479.1 hypothetical protein nbrc107696_39250 [Gordonia spumicola]
MCEWDPRCSGSDDLVGHALALIARGSWAVTGVYGDETSPPIAYTTGLTELGRPELVLTGVDPERAGPVLNEAAARVLLQPDFAAGSTIGGLTSAAGVDFAAIDVIDTSDLRVTALLFGRGFQAVQLVWTDRDHRLPWDRGYQLAPDEQPLLGVPMPAG